MFTPRFNTHVFIQTSIPGFNPVQVRPGYCLTERSADELLDILTGAGMRVTRFNADPTEFAAASPFTFSEQVPWFTIQDPKAVPDTLSTFTADFNAAHLAMWWMRVQDSNTALMMCRKEIWSGLADTQQKMDAANG